MSDTTVAQGGHPRGLYTLFFSEMWERFCYYGMRVLLTLYLVKSLFKGDSEAALIYGAYTALIYAAPVLGGRMADTYLGYRLAIIFGAICMAIGEFLILGSNEEFLLFGMGFLIVGNGYFKANISTIVGKLYSDDDPRRDSGFTIFYIGINIGALLATTVVAYVGETYGFKYGFGLAGAGMLLGLLTFWFGRRRYAEAEGLDITEDGMKSVGPLKVYQLVLLTSFLLIPACYFLISKNEWLTYLLLFLFGWVAYSLIKVGYKEGKVWGQRMIALCIFMIINVVFWACFEQAGTSLTLFADRNVSRTILGWTMPASMTQFFNPFFIIVFGSYFSVMWVQLTKKGRNPSIPMKFALGIFQLGLGFLITKVGYAMQLEGFLVPLWTLIFLYLLHTTGELFLSPIGLSMVTKLSPKHAAGTAMGGWFLSFAIANFLGGQIATLTGAEGHGPKPNSALDVTVMEAKAGDESFDLKAWEPLEPGEASNITYGLFLEKQEFVEFRNSLESDLSFGDWKAKNSGDQESDASSGSISNEAQSEPAPVDAIPAELPDEGEQETSPTDAGTESPEEESTGMRDAGDQMGVQVDPGPKGEPSTISTTVDEGKMPNLDSVLWLDPVVWNGLKEDLARIAKVDSVKKAADEEAELLDYSTWKYYSKGFEKRQLDDNGSMKVAFDEHRELVQKESLDKYVGVFGNIGYVLLAFALLIALLNKPLKSLMHGVE